MASHIGKITQLTTVHQLFDTRIFHKQAKTPGRSWAVVPSDVLTIIVVRPLSAG